MANCNGVDTYNSENYYKCCEKDRILILAKATYPGTILKIIMPLGHLIKANGSDFEKMRKKP